MAVDTPARIAILGAGPIGLEAALYARYLGYDVDVYERGRAAENVLRWGHVRMFTPFGMNRSTLGLAALRAQDADFSPPGDDELLTGREWHARYLGPLSQCDLVVDSLREQTTVESIGRAWLRKVELPGSIARGDELFRLLVRDASGGERIEAADVVIDASGVFSNPNWLGQGGIPAVGESAARPHIEYGLPDVLGAERNCYAGKRILLAGAGYSAATTSVALAQLAAEDKTTSVVWITRQRAAHAAKGPIVEIPCDRLHERQRLAASANELARGGSSQIQHFAGAAVDRIDYDGKAGQFRVTFSFLDDVDFPDEQTFDRVIANVGYRPDRRVHEELQVHECYASSGPLNLAAALQDETALDGLDSAELAPDALLNPEPNFYILGAKSYGRNSQFLFHTGLRQIRDMFGILGERATLDLYATAQSHP